ncbi:MAG: MATE family efflux transporter [Candidatus Omnitrophica bacterium]|nr:MATE family efflux transporter [Candidatus Omnitrophota bacterium]
MVCIIAIMKKFRKLVTGDSQKKGGIKEMVAIALPMVVSQACYTAMTFTDRMFLSRLGIDFMNASMVGGLTVFMMMTFFLGLTGYATAVVAQYLGAGQKDQCAVVLTQAVIIAFLAYPLIFFCRPLAYRLFDIFGIMPSQLVPQKLYFDILIGAVIITLLRSCLSAFFSGVGKTKMVMMSGLTAMSVNVIVNYILIFGKFGMPAMGIRGAAYGTIIGSASGLAVLLISYLRKKNFRKFNVSRSFRFNGEVMRKLFHFGYPAGLEMFLNLLAFDVIVMIFHSAGAVAATASTIVFNWDMVSFVPLLGIEVGVTSLVGRYMGAGKPDTAHKATMSGLKLGMVYSALVFILFAGLPGMLAEVFRPAAAGSIFAAALPVTVFMIRLASIYVLAEAVFVVFIGALRGAGDTFWAMFISVALHWVLVPILYVMLKVLNTGLEVAWQAVVGMFFLFSVFVYLRYRSGRWRGISVVKLPKVVSVPGIINDFHEPSDL